MPRRVLVACLVTLLTCLRAAGAQDAPSKAPAPPAPAGSQAPTHSPAPAPASPSDATPAPSHARPDRDDASPRATLKRLAAALRDGDGDRIRLVMHATTPAET